VFILFFAKNYIQPTLVNTCAKWFCCKIGCNYGKKAAKMYLTGFWKCQKVSF